MDQAQTAVQPTALPADVEAILQPQDSLSNIFPPAAPEADPVQVQPQAPAAPPPQATTPAPPAEPHVPLHVLLEERKERQAYQAQIRQLIEAQQRALQPQPQPIDPVAEPERFAAAVQQEFARKSQQMQDMAVHNRANTSEMLAKSKHGAQAVETARDAAVQAGLGNHFLGQPDPYEAVMEWHRGQTAAKEIGDPAAYKEKLKAEILAELAKGIAAPGQARPGAPQILPPSLSSATRASTTSPVIQDAGDFFKTTLFAKPQRT